MCTASLKNYIRQRSGKPFSRHCARGRAVENIVYTGIDRPDEEMMVRSVLLLVASSAMA